MIEFAVSIIILAVVFGMTVSSILFFLGLSGVLLAYGWAELSVDWIRGKVDGSNRKED